MATLALDLSVLHRQVPLFEEQNDCLYFTMGLAHLATQYLLLVENTSVDEQEVDPPTSSEPETDTEALLHFLLGLRSFSIKLLEIIGDMDTYPEKTLIDLDHSLGKPGALRELLR